MTGEQRQALLASLLHKQGRVQEINARIFALAERRNRIERIFLEELAALLGKEGAILLDGHYECAGSPIGRCVFEVTTKTDDLVCLICEGKINR